MDQSKDASGVISPASSKGFRPVHLTLIMQFTLAAALTLGLVMTTLTWWSSRQITERNLRSSADAAAMFLESALGPYVQELAEGGELTSASLEALKLVVQNVSKHGPVVSLKVWLPDGRITYNSSGALSAEAYELDEVAAAFEGEVFSHIDELHGDQHIAERALEADLFEIFAPLRDWQTGEVVAVVEIYENAEPLLAELRQARIKNWIVHGGSSLAMLALLSLIVYRGSRKIEQQKGALVTSLQTQTELAINNGELLRRAQDASALSSQLDERIRRRYGARLHDGPCQQLSYTLLRLEEFNDFMPKDAQNAAALRSLLQDVTDVSLEAMVALREQSNEMFLPEYDSNGNLADVLNAVARTHSCRTKTPVICDVERASEVTQYDLMRCAARVVQEALNNAYKHADGIDQSVHAEIIEDVVVITVTNGGPTPPDELWKNVYPVGHLGIVSMKYRVEALGGSLQIGRSSFATTQVVFRLPNLEISSDSGLG